MTRKRGEKLYAQVFRQIRAYIIQHGLQPGDLLPTEQALMEMLGVSRNVLREAIKSMELMGMVTAQAGRGTVLNDFNMEFVFQNVIFAAAADVDRSILEMLEIRKRLELGFVRQAFETLTDEDIVALGGVMARIKEQWQQHRLFHAEDREFHMMIFSRVGNGTLNSVLQAIWDVDANFKTEEKVPHLDDTIVKHENILRALEARNSEAFEAAMMAHFASGKYSRRDSFAEY